MKSPFNGDTKTRIPELADGEMPDGEGETPFKPQIFVSTPSDGGDGYLFNDRVTLIEQVLVAPGKAFEGVSLWNTTCGILAILTLVLNRSRSKDGLTRSGHRIHEARTARCSSSTRTTKWTRWEIVLNAHRQPSTDYGSRTRRWRTMSGPPRVTKLLPERIIESARTVAVDLRIPRLHNH